MAWAKSISPLGFRGGRIETSRAEYVVPANEFPLSVSGGGGFKHDRRVHVGHRRGFPSRFPGGGGLKPYVVPGYSMTESVSPLGFRGGRIETHSCCRWSYCPSFSPLGFRGGRIETHAPQLLRYTTYFPSRFPGEAD